MIKRKSSKKGFTLAELIVVVAVMAILAAIVVPVTLHYIDETQSVADTAYTQDVATWAGSCIVGLQERSQPVTAASVRNEISKLYANDFPYEIGYIPSGQIGSISAPNFLNVQEVSDVNGTYVAIYLEGTTLSVYLVKDGAEDTTQRIMRVLPM